MKMPNENLDILELFSGSTVLEVSRFYGDSVWWMIRPAVEKARDRNT